MSNNGGVYCWSKTATANASADTTVNYQEGQAPSSLNDSARSAMASVAKWRDDISGAIVTTGSAAAYSVASNQNFDALANFKGQTIAFTPHVTNATGPITMTVDGFANLPLRSAPGVELPAGVLVQGTPYAATCGVDGVLYLMGLFGNPYNIPIGGSIDFWGPTAPNSSFALMYGQAISRAAYATLFALLGTTFGVGDGTTTFSLPDLRGRVVAGADGMGGVAANRLTDAVSGIDSLGDAGGAQTITLTTPQIPSHNHTATSTDSGHIHGGGQASIQNSFGGTNGGSQVSWSGGAGVTTTAVANITTTINNTGGGGAHSNVQPTIIANKLLRII